MPCHRLRRCPWSVSRSNGAFQVNHLEEYGSYETKSLFNCIIKEIQIFLNALDTEREFKIFAIQTAFSFSFSYNKQIINNIQITNNKQFTNNTQITNNKQIANYNNTQITSNKHFTNNKWITNIQQIYKQQKIIDNIKITISPNYTQQMNYKKL